MWYWPLTSKINRVNPLTMVNMSANFDKEIHNCLVSIMFTSLFPYMSIVTLTFDLWPPKSIGFILSSRLTCLPSLTKKQCSFYHVHKVHAWMGAHMRGRTEPQKRYYIPTATRCAGINMAVWEYTIPVCVAMVFCTSFRSSQPAQFKDGTAKYLHKWNTSVWGTHMSPEVALIGIVY